MEKTNSKGEYLIMNNKFLSTMEAIGIGLMIWGTARLTYKYHKLKAIYEIQGVILEEALKSLKEEKQKAGS